MNIRTHAAIFAVATMSAVGLQALPAQAAVTSGTSTAWGLSANLNLLSLIPLVSVPPTPLLSNTAPAAYNNTISALSFSSPSPCGGLLQPTCVLAANAISAQIDSNVNGGAGENLPMPWVL